MSKNKTQTISVSILVIKLLRVKNFPLFNYLPSYYTKMCLNAVRWKVVDWIHLAHDGDSFGEHGNEHRFA